MSDDTEKLNSPGEPVPRKNGGARPGSGRKRKHDKFGTAIQQGEQKIADRLPLLIDRMFELADGVLVEEIDFTGKPFIYQKPPDYKALSYLIDRIMGKATERRVIELDRPLDELSDDELRAIAES
jgi:hypothetical protein